MNGYKLLYGASLLMVLCFCGNVIIDRVQYSDTLNSAPFWVWVLCDAALWLLPAGLAFLAGFVAKRKLKNKENAK